MDHLSLKSLMETHPSWPGADDSTLLAWVTDETAVASEFETISSGGIFAAAMNNLTEWNALSDAERQTVRDILMIHSGEGVPTAAGEPARAALISILGTGTKSELQAAITTTVSRATDAGVSGTIRMGDIQYARTL